MENVLPIILGLIYLAYRQYKKSEKNKQKPVTIPYNMPEESVEETKEEKLEEFIDQFFGLPKAPERRVSAQMEVEDLDELDAMEYEKEESDEQELYSVENDDSIDLKTRYKSQFEMIQNKQENKSETIDFDLKTAIIYDAVFNPPYIEKYTGVKLS